MNERIKELMANSGMVSESNVPGAVWTTNMSVKTAEKFAELIVKECFTVIKDSGEFSNTGVDFIDREFKKHFGVK